MYCYSNATFNKPVYRTFKHQRIKEIAEREVNNQKQITCKDIGRQAIRLWPWQILSVDYSYVFGIDEYDIFEILAIDEKDDIAKRNQELIEAGFEDKIYNTQFKAVAPTHGTVYFHQQGDSTFCGWFFWDELPEKDRNYIISLASLKKTE
jgi:hypothetical protein